MTTLSPSSTCGVKVGLCLPRRMLATMEARRPTTRPSASIRTHFFVTSAGFCEKVFISFSLTRTFREGSGRKAFLVAWIGARPRYHGDGRRPAPKTKRRPPRPLFAGRLIGEGGRGVNIDVWLFTEEN